MSYKENETTDESDSLETLLRRLENALLLSNNLDPDERERIIEERGVRDFYPWALTSEDVKPFRTIEGEFIVLEPEETISLQPLIEPSKSQEPSHE